MKYKKYNSRKLALVSFLILSVILIAVGCSLNSDKSDKKVTVSTTVEVTTTVAETTTTAQPKEPVKNSDKIAANSTITDNGKRLTEKEYRELIDFDAQLPFTIKINRTNNFVCVYGMDKEGRYSVPYKVFRCSVGLTPGSTPVGAFSISDKYDWRLMVDYSYAQYAIRIYGSIMIHSVPYYTPNKNDLEVDEYNKLGSPASLGCIRMNVANTKWIYDNCPAGTTVVIYDDENEKPPFKPARKRKAVSEGKYAGWDPTDPDPENPYNKKSSDVESESESSSEPETTESNTIIIKKDE